MENEIRHCEAQDGLQIASWKADGFCEVLVGNLPVERDVFWDVEVVYYC